MSDTHVSTEKNAALSGFQITTIMIALITTLAGLGGMAWNRLSPADEPQHALTTPDAARSVIESSAGEDPDVADTRVETWSEWASTKGVRYGLSFLGAFAIGYAFRMFLKTMAILTALAVTAILLLSYFNVYNIDFSQVQTQWDSHSEWITTQATKAKDFVWTYLPSSTLAMVGFFVGMLRR